MLLHTVVGFGCHKYAIAVIVRLHNNEQHLHSKGGGITIITIITNLSDGFAFAATVS